MIGTAAQVAVGLVGQFAGVICEVEQEGACTEVLLGTNMATLCRLPMDLAQRLLQVCAETLLRLQGWAAITPMRPLPDQDFVVADEVVIHREAMGEGVQVQEEVDMEGEVCQWARWPQEQVEVPLQQI